MKIHRDVEQGSSEWLRLRLGVITASSAERIVTPKTLKPSSAADALVAELVAERLIGQPCSEASGPWIERGRDLEVEARNEFAFLHEAVEQVGFISDDAVTFGCSPDAIVEGRFGYEAKCPSARIHVAYLLEPATFDAYVRMQVQFGLWVTGWPLWYAHSFCPGLPSLVREVRPDVALHAAFSEHVPAVLARVAVALAKVEAMGEPTWVEAQAGETPEQELQRTARNLFA